MTGARGAEKTTGAPNNRERGHPIMTTRRKREANKRRLTDLFVRSKAKPRAAAYLVWDTYQRGLALRVLPTGNKSWVTVYSRHGRPRWLHLGNAGAIGLAEARTLAAEAMLAVAR